MRRAAARLASVLGAERERWFLWAPVAFGAGILVYFALPVEPPAWPAPLIAGAAALGARLWRRHTASMLALFALALAAAGFTLVERRSDALADPVLRDEVGPGAVIGRIVAVAPRESGAVRLLLDHVTIEDLATAQTPERVRVVVRAKERPHFVPGQWVDLFAVLAPPSGPATPGAFDFARDAYFQRIGGMGFALGPPRLVAPPPGADPDGFLLWLNGLRQALAERILAVGALPESSVSAALLVGERGAIPDEVNRAMQNSGLAHLLSISGLHIGLFAGLIFLAVRAALAAVEAVALRHPIKKWAAAVALAAAFGYVLISGMSVPTQRSFLMAGLVLLAVVLDRTSISMRLIAWAALAVVAASPESILGPSFQMSFAATMALIATYEVLRAPLARWQGQGRLGTRALAYLAGVVLTTVVAGAATAPFSVYHFNRLADYSVLANLVAVPLTAFWVMPWGIAVFLLLPFGAESLALVPMNWGVAAILWTAREVAALGGAVTLVPAMPATALLLMVGGGLWLCLWRRRWRLIGVAGIALGVALVPAGDRPDILVSGDAKLLGVATADGGFALSSTRRARFEAEIWLRRYGIREPAPWPDAGPSEDGRLSCDDLGCIYRAHGRTAALIAHEAALEEDCTLADVVVSLVPVRGPCQAPVVIDRFDLWRKGAHAVWLGDDGVRAQSSADAQGDRPWTT
ncbi:MAG TPA: ComEC/Rec2 family competence protein, partial [Alphaproteobacteria bacterium]|nr:ComEC/Rec2 family competence protein [Alphaproteobacteria bacterium]